MRTDGTPDDYSADDVRQYYDEKLRHREEVIPWLIGAWIVFIVIAVGAFGWRVAFGQEPVPFEEPCQTGSCTVYNQALVWSLTGDDRTFRWTQNANDVATMALFYELQLLEFPPKSPQVPIFTAELPEPMTSQVWTPNRAGVYFLKVRACRTDIVQDGSEPDSEQRPDQSWVLCSIWATSIDPTFTDPTAYPRGFIILAQLAPATGGGIE